MQLESINVGARDTVRHGNKSITTGICKYSVPKAWLGEFGVRQDEIVDLEVHGGPDQAVYAYSADDYDWWENALSCVLEPGLFGENLTIRGMSSDMNIGDRLLIGEVVLEATAPRIPCRTLSARMKDASFGLAFRKAERPGVYFRVLNSGEVSAGDAVTYVSNDTSDVSVLDLYRFHYALRYDADELQRYLNAPIAVRFRAKIEAKLRGDSALPSV